MLRSKFGVERKGIIDEFGAIFEAERCWSAQSSSAVPGKAWFVTIYREYFEPE